MKTRGLIAVIWLLALYSPGQGVLYAVDPGKRGSERMEGDTLVLRIPMKRIPITHAILRHDTEDSKILWLELHMSKRRDSGDGAFLSGYSNNDETIYTRSSEFHEDGCKWAVKFKELRAARVMLSQVSKAYELDSAFTLDKTKAANKAR